MEDIKKINKKQYNLASVHFDIIATCPICGIEQKVEFISKYKKYPKEHTCVDCHNDFIYVSPLKRYISFKL